VSPDAAFVYDADRQWTIPERAIRRLAFAGNVVVTAADANPGASTWQVGFWNLGAEPDGTSMPLQTDAALPWNSQLVLDDGGRVLAIVGKEWQWISPSSSQSQELPFAADRWSGGFAPGPVAPRFAPQAFDAKSDMLLFMDDHGLFAFVQPAAKPSLYRVLPITEQRWDAGMTRQLTRTSLSAFASGRVISIDDLGTVAHLWRVPAPSDSAVDLAGSATEVAGPAESNACKQGSTDGAETFCSVGNDWTASVPPSAPFEVQVSYRGPSPRPSEDWSVSADVRPRGVIVGADGSRVLLLFDDEVRYVEKGRRNVAVHPIRKSVRAAVFGPGPRRVTVMTAEDVMIFGPGHWDSENGEWQAPCLTSASWLVPKKDERSVVLYSRFWMHRLTENTSPWARWMARLTREGRLWPEVTSVLTEAPISRRHFVAEGNDVGLSQNGRRVDDADAAFDDVSTFDGAFSPTRWLATLVVQPCSREGSGPNAGWQEQWCQWERTVNRRAGVAMAH
jgi:hypothetical protein